MFESQFAHSAWKEWIWRLYDLTPLATDELRKWCSPGIALVRHLRIPLYLLRGPTANEDKQTTAIIAGAGSWFDDIAHNFYAGEPIREHLGTVPCYDLAKVLRSWSPRVELIAAHADRLTSRILFDRNYLILPGSLSLSVPVPKNLSQLEHLSTSAKKDLRIIRRHSLHYEVSRKSSEFDDFYDRYYIPLMRQRHGANALIRYRNLLRRSHRQGGILWITRDGHRIAGCVFQQRHRLMHLVSSGVEGGRVEWIKQGALAASDYYGICYAHEQDCTRVELGSAAPYLSDNLLQYKRKWGPMIASASCTYDILLRWPRMTRAIADLLASSPLIFRDGHRLSSITAMRNASPALEQDAIRLFSKLSVSGLRRFWIASASGWDTAETARTIGLTELRLIHEFNLPRLTGAHP